MSPDEFFERHTVEYRGYQILFGSVRKGGESLLLAHAPLGRTAKQDEQLLADAKAWIDEREAA